MVATTQRRRRGLAKINTCFDLHSATGMKHVFNVNWEKGNSMLKRCVHPIFLPIFFLSLLFFFFGVSPIGSGIFNANENNSLAGHDCKTITY